MIASSRGSFRNDRTTLARRVREVESAYLRPYWRQIALALAAMLVQSLVLLPLPWLQGRALDWLVRMVSEGLTPSRSWLVSFFAVAAAIPLSCLIARMGLGWYSSGLMNRVSLEFVRELTDALHRKLQRLPLSFFDRQETGQLMARLTNDVGTLLIFLSAGSLQLAADLALAAGIVFGLLVLSWPLAIVSLAALPLFLWNHRRSETRIWQLSRGVQQQTAELYAVLSERLSAVRVVRACGAETSELAEFNRRLDRQTTHSKQTLRATSWQSFGAVLIGGWATGILACLAAAVVQFGALTLGEAVSFLAYLGLLYQPLVRLTQFYGGISATLAAVDRIAELLEEPEPAPIATRRLPTPVRGELALENVSFAYDAAGPVVLKGLHLRADPGMTIGICGPSGSGKSTLLSLLPRLYDLPAAGGRILLDGCDIRALDGCDLRRNVLLVPQQARLFEGTIRFNLTYAARTAEEASLRRVLEAVDLAEFVDSLPRGLETWVGERGASLSGGQRQRLALARGLLVRSPVLLLDDCTSALDAQTEARVRRQIAEFSPRQTRLIVSHKQETLWEADWLVMLDHGGIVRQGDPRELLATAGFSGPDPSKLVFPSLHTAGRD